MREHGSPAFSEAELEARPRAERRRADLTLAQALGLRLASPGRAARDIGCPALRGSPRGRTGIALPSGSLTLANETSAATEVMLGRFATGLPVDLGPLGAGAKAALTIPGDNSSRPWRLGLKGAGPVRFCTGARP